VTTKASTSGDLPLENLYRFFSKIKTGQLARCLEGDTNEKGYYYMAINKRFKYSFALSLQKTSFEAVAHSDGRIYDRMQKMVDLGFNGIELAIRSPREIDAEELKKGLVASGLSVAAIGTGQAYIEEGLSLSHAENDRRTVTIHRLYNHIDLAEKLHTQVIIGLIRGLSSPNQDKLVALDLFSQSIRTCLDYAEKKHVNLVIEPLNRYECALLNTVSDTVDFINKISHPNLKILADTFHMNIEEPSLTESLKLCAPWLVHVHIADSNRWYPGAGHIDFDEIISTLGEIGYTEYISGEMIPKPSEEVAMRNFIRFFKEQNSDSH
jgi:5-keto-L-gluconate epimerase